jgi:hypothetical protein
MNLPSINQPANLGRDDSRKLCYREIQYIEFCQVSNRAGDRRALKVVVV